MNFSYVIKNFVAQVHVIKYSRITWLHGLTIFLKNDLSSYSKLIRARKLSEVPRLSAFGYFAKSVNNHLGRHG
jgi:hypothetical protein